MLRRVDADVAAQQRVFERLERFVVELAAREHAGERVRELAARQAEPGLQALGPRALFGRRCAGWLRARRALDGLDAAASGSGAASGLRLKKSNNVDSRRSPRGPLFYRPVPFVPSRRRSASSAARSAAACVRFPPRRRRAADRRPGARDALQLARPGPHGLVDARPVRGQRRADARSAVARCGAGRGDRPRSRAHRGARSDRAGASVRTGSRRTPPTPVPAFARDAAVRRDLPRPAVRRRSLAMAAAGVRGAAFAGRLHLRGSRRAASSRRKASPCIARSRAGQVHYHLAAA